MEENIKQEILHFCSTKQKIFPHNVIAVRKRFAPVTKAFCFSSAKRKISLRAEDENVGISQGFSKEFGKLGYPNFYIFGISQV